MSNPPERVKRIKVFKTTPSRREATKDRRRHSTPQSRILAFTRRLDPEGEERSVSSTMVPQGGQRHPRTPRCQVFTRAKPAFTPTRSRTATTKIAAPPARTPLAHTPPAQPQRHHCTGATTNRPGSPTSAAAVNLTTRRRAEPHQLPQTTPKHAADHHERRHRRHREGTSTDADAGVEESRRRPWAWPPDPAAEPPMWPPQPPHQPGGSGPPPRRPAPPGARAVEGHRGAPARGPASRGEKTPAYPTRARREGPPSSSARRRPPAAAGGGGERGVEEGEGAAAAPGFRPSRPLGSDAGTSTSLLASENDYGG
jgi:hypothetical protein